MKKAELMKIPAKHFGLPSARKFPMQDERHLRSAIAYFYTAKSKDRRELANNIVRRHKQLKSGVRISKKNPLFKYVPPNMRKEQESSKLMSEATVNLLKGILNEESRQILEALLKQDGITTVDDLDSAVPETYASREKFLGTLKSVIINEDEEEDCDYVLMYRDYNANTNLMNANNGGITESSAPILLVYDGSLNETAALNPVVDRDHIQFSAILREWNELYVNGHRDLYYDRLMIESWTEYAQTLMDNHSNIPSSELEQKLADIGYVKTRHGFQFSINDKAIELGYPSDLPDMDFDEEQMSDIYSKAITLNMVMKGDRNADTSYYDHSVRRSAID